MKETDLIYSNVIALNKKQFEPRELDGIRSRFTHSNPNYVILKANHVEPDAQTPPIIKTFFENESHLAVPRGAADWLRMYLMEKDRVIRIIDKRVEKPKIDFDFNFGAKCANGKTFDSLYDYQEAAIQYLVKNQQGIFQADCGGGKTLVGIGLIDRIKQPTIIVVHTGDLGKQWLQEIGEKTHYAAGVGMVGLGNWDLRPVTISTVQTIWRMQVPQRMDFLSNFGCIIMDECFTPNSRVWRSNKFCPASCWTEFRDIVAGRAKLDQVITYNFETGQNERKKVNRLIVTPKFGTKDNYIIINEDFMYFTCTQGQEIFVMDRGWVKAKDIKVGMLLAYSQKPYTMPVISVRELNKNDNRHRLDRTYVCDLDVADNHNYYVEGILVKNCHHVPAKSFAECLNYSGAKFRFGLTATPKRSDGLEHMMYDLISNRTFVADPELVTGSNVRSQLPTVHIIPTGYVDLNRYGMKMKQAMLTKLSKNDQRNSFIVNRIVQDWNDGYFPLIISKRVDQCKQMKFWLESKGMKVALLIGEVNAATRKDFINQCRSKLIDAVVGTTVADEGLDIPQLDCLHIITPHSNESRLKQQSGRIQRFCDGKKEPVIRDYVDTGTEFSSTLRKRLSYYKKWGYRIIEVK